MVLNKRFRALSVIVVILWIIGVVVFLIGVFAGIRLAPDLITLLRTPGADWVWTTKDIITTAVFVISTLIGLLILALAEIIGVGFAIETNTRS